jgi:cytochrome c oxidase accessory protein FixG
MTHMTHTTPAPADTAPPAEGPASEPNASTLRFGLDLAETPIADSGPSYVARRKIYPQSVHGTFRKIKWSLLFVTLGVYYLLPFVRWDRGPDAPAQAVLVDLAGRRFYFFFIEIWPQEVYYITGLLILAAMTLFLMNAVAGRLWCGYLCPQTVWTDLFLTIERWVEGDRREHMLRDRQPWTIDRTARACLKHLLWLGIAWWTGGAWVLYFADAPTLVYDLATFQAPFVAYAWIGILTFTTYALAGHMREQVCLYMCPWPRIQAALIDEDALNVTYRYDRGEPRASLKKSELLHAQGSAAGDCIDCLQCVHVCPTGVDIRNGPNLGCIQCGLCIDACDTVMGKVGRSARLIAYDTDLNIKRRQAGLPALYRFVRPRTLLYAAIIAVVGSVMLYALATREVEGVSVIHDRNPMFVRLSDGALRNAYTIRIVNKRHEPRTFSLGVSGLPGVVIELVGSQPRPDNASVVEVGPDQTREVRVLVTDRGHPEQSSKRIMFQLTDVATGDRAQAADHFFGP